jgi:hypothetical protein
LAARISIQADSQRAGLASLTVAADGDACLGYRAVTNGYCCVTLGAVRIADRDRASAECCVVSTERDSTRSDSDVRITNCYCAVAGSSVARTD